MRFEKGHVPWNKYNSTRKANSIRRGFKKRLCIACGISFYPSLPRHVYCSKRCTKAAYRMRNRERLLFNLKERIRRTRKLVIKKLGSKCVNCGEKDYRVLQINHINGGGNKEKSDSIFHKEILDGKREGDFDLRCANCNILYEYERESMM